MLTKITVIYKRNYVVGNPLMSQLFLVSLFFTISEIKSESIAYNSFNVMHTNNHNSDILMPMGIKQKIFTSSWVEEYDKI